MLPTKDLGVVHGGGRPCRRRGAALPSEGRGAEGRANMGARMKMTTGMALLFQHHVLAERRSPYDAMLLIRAAPSDAAEA